MGPGRQLEIYEMGNFREWGSGESDDYEDKHGAFQIRLPGSPFAMNSVISIQ
jgi:hypothetical protein